MDYNIFSNIAPAMPKPRSLGFIVGEKTPTSKTSNSFSVDQILILTCIMVNRRYEKKKEVKFGNGTGSPLSDHYLSLIHIFDVLGSSAQLFACHSVLDECRIGDIRRWKPETHLIISLGLNEETRL